MESNNMKRKKSRGRQKLEIKKIENKDRLNVTFSKRRRGFFNKARMLSSSCGVDIAVIVFSPTGRIYTFASPSVDSLINPLFPETDSSKGEEEDSGLFWDVPIENMDFMELLFYAEFLLDQKRKVDLRAEEMMTGRMSQMDNTSIN